MPAAGTVPPESFEPSWNGVLGISRPALRDGRVSTSASQTMTAVGFPGGREERAMRTEHTIDPVERVVVLKVSGDLGDQELLGLAEELEKIPGLRPDFALLIDLREARGEKVTAAGARALAARPLVMSSESRRAVVVPSELGFGMARMYEILREGSGGSVRVFRDHDEARSWVAASDP